MYQAYVVTRAETGEAVGSVEAQSPEEAIYRLVGGEYGRTDFRAWSGRNRPLAAPGLTPYRYAGLFGCVFIGADDDAEALREAARSIDGEPDPARLERWTPDGYKYVSTNAKEA